MSWLSIAEYKEPAENPLPQLKALEGFKGIRENRRHLPVKGVLGHKSIVNTDRYQHSTYTSDKYKTNRPKTSPEEDALISAGFEYVRFDDRKQVPIYRKRK